MTFSSLLVSATLALAGVQSRQQDRIDSQLVVQWLRRKAIANPSGIEFQDAQATYGPTVLTCDKLTIDLTPGNKHFVAEGHVHVLDIDGTLNADRLSVDWAKGTGTGQNVHLLVQGFMVRAASAVITETRYELDDIDATPCANEEAPIFEIKAPKAIFSKNGDGRILHPHIYVLGRNIFNPKEYYISANRRSNGLPLPNLAFSKSSGPSGSWYPGILLNDSTALNGGIRLGEDQRPSENLLLSKSLLPLAVAPGGFVPYSDFYERFGFSYFENIYIPTPESERAFVSARRVSLSLGTTFNESPAARRVSTPFNKPEELVFEDSGSIAGLGAFAQLRAQRIEQIGGPSEDRLLASATVSLPTIVIFPLVYTDIRLDGFGSFGNALPYGWGHLQFGVVAKLSDRLRLGAAYTSAAQFGTPLFITDQPYKMKSVNLRGDLLLGPHKLSVLLKYDPDGKRWYDSEFEVAQAVGCLEPYVLYRSNPRGYGFGLRLRLDNLMEALRRRGVLKTAKNPENPG